MIRTRSTNTDHNTEDNVNNTDTNTNTILMYIVYCTLTVHYMY